jgi:hypothetical protein
MNQAVVDLPRRVSEKDNDSIFRVYHLLEDTSRGHRPRNAKQNRLVHPSGVARGWLFFDPVALPPAIQLHTFGVRMR